MNHNIAIKTTSAAVLMVTLPQQYEFGFDLFEVWKKHLVVVLLNRPAHCGSPLLRGNAARHPALG